MKEGSQPRALIFSECIKFTCLYRTGLGIGGILKNVRRQPKPIILKKFKLSTKAKLLKAKLKLKPIANRS
jgi:hypothetical protein